MEKSELSDLINPIETRVDRIFEKFRENPKSAKDPRVKVWIEKLFVTLAKMEEAIDISD